MTLLPLGDLVLLMSRWLAVLLKLIYCFCVGNDGEEALPLAPVKSFGLRGSACF